MKTRNVAITTVMVTSALLTGAAAAMLFWEIGKLRTVERSVNDCVHELTNSMMLDPFPSSSNVVTTKANVKTLENDLAALCREMNAGQVVGNAEMEPLAWRAFLTRKKNSLIDDARSAEKGSVKLPASFSFGFEKYDDGTSPKNQGDVGRLDLQLKIIGELCAILYRSGISELTAITRKQFEEPAVVDEPAEGTTGETNVVAVVSGPALFTKEHFTIGLKAKETPLIELLNNLASSKMFTVVTMVRVVGDSEIKLRPVPVAPVISARPDEGAPRAEVADKMRRELITGRSKERPASVYLELNVYEFDAPAKRPTS